ncbi:TonB-dependent siderophore receptor [Hyphomicrobium sp. 2TAF46]|uniref:TonB-dependent siderophore receptor n=1 Tax=Hyphomicrobium sp. 2TAF46 TaxID=3233019 RepID=UPI003F8FDEAD
MKVVARRRGDRAPVILATAMATAAVGIWTPAAAQSAQGNSTEDVQLPSVVVESSAAKPKTVVKKKAKASKAATKPVSAPSVPPQQLAEPSGDQQVDTRGIDPVKGYLPHISSTATKTDTPILETPQSISVVTQDQISDQQAQNINEALRYTPGVSLDGFGANIFFDSIKIRGFNAPQYLDGLRLPAEMTQFALPRIEPYGLERIEVLKGPSSGLYGQSDPGGLINMVSKRPLDTPHYEVQGTFGSFDRVEGAFDVGGPVPTNPDFLYRVVGLVRDSDTQVDFQQDNKIFIAPSMTWRLDPNTRFTFLSQYQKIENDGYQQYVPGQATLLPNPNGHIPLSRYLGEPGFDHYDMQQWSVGYELEHRFNSALQFRQNLRYMDTSNDMQSMRGDVFVGDSDFYRTPIYVDANAQNFAVDNQLQADFATGVLAHKILAGVDYQYSTGSNVTYLASWPVGYIPIDVYNPVYGAYPIPSRDDLNRFIDLSTKQQQTGIYLQDQVKLDRWTLSLSGRQDWSSVETTSAAVYPRAGQYNRDDSAQTGRVGLSYLFDFGLAPYISYSTSFVPNAGADISGNTFRPTTGEGKEVGVKFMPNGTNLMFTAALFDIRQNDILTADSQTGGLTSVQTDQARVRGFEFEVRGNVTRELQIVGGYSRLDPEITKSKDGNAGNYLPNVNLDQASLWGKYTWFDGPLAGFGLSGGVRYVGENYGDQTNTIYIPSHTLFDAGLSYDFAYLDHKLDGWQAQLNATNLTDEYYVTSCQSGLAYCGLGQGRTILGTIKYSWR